MPAPRAPIFSVIVPTYRRPAQLVACLEALAGLDYSHDLFEVVVVEDEEHTEREAIIAPFRRRLDLTFLNQPHAGPAAARNTGARRARGQFLAFTDDDCRPDSDWLDGLARHMMTAPDTAVGGRTLNLLPTNVFSVASQMLVDYLYRVYNADSSQAQFLTSNNIALPADRFRALGGFNTAYHEAAAEDRDLCHRWRGQGYRMIYDEQIVVYHVHPLTFRTFWKQQFAYGRGAYQFHRTSAVDTREVYARVPRAFYLNLILYPWSRVGAWPGLALMGLMLVSQLAHASAFVWEFVRSLNGRRHAPGWHHRQK